MKLKIAEKKIAYLEGELLNMKGKKKPEVEEKKHAEEQKNSPWYRI